MTIRSEMDTNFLRTNCYFSPQSASKICCIGLHHLKILEDFVRSICDWLKKFVN